MKFGGSKSQKSHETWSACGRGGGRNGRGGCGGGHRGGVDGCPHVVGCCDGGAQRGGGRALGHAWNGVRVVGLARDCATVTVSESADDSF
jgi:hypothetical protein